MYLSFGKLSLLKYLEVSVEASHAGNIFLHASGHLKVRVLTKDESLWKFLYGKVLC